MSTEIKTLDGWCEFSDRTGMESIYDYLRKGDIVSEDTIHHLISHMPPRTYNGHYLQIDEPCGYAYDLAHHLKPIFWTFAKSGDDAWRFYGKCHEYETINKG